MRELAPACGASPAGRCQSQGDSPRWEHGLEEGLQRDLRVMPCAPGHPEEKATPPGDTGHVGPQGAASGVVPGAGSGRHRACLPAWVSSSLWLLLRVLPTVTLRRPFPRSSGPLGPRAGSLWLTHWPPTSAAAGCVPLGLPGAPCPSPSCSVCTSPSSPPATGTEPAAPTGECSPPTAHDLWGPGGQFTPRWETEAQDAEATSTWVAETDTCLNVGSPGLRMVRW